MALNSNAQPSTNNLASSSLDVKNNHLLQGIRDKLSILQHAKQDIKNRASVTAEGIKYTHHGGTISLGGGTIDQYVGVG
jgi:hypothetical protein